VNVAGKPILRINFDESSVKMHVDPRLGLVAEPCPKRRRQLLREGQGPDLKTKRSAVTLIGFACNDARVQKLLPQVFVCNEHVVNFAEHSELVQRCGENVYMVRRKSSWVNAKFVASVLKLLAKSLESELPKYHTVLYMDTAPVHLHSSVLEVCSAAGILVHIIPASTTAWLQPLDVAVFASLKSWIAQEIEQKRLASADGVVSRFTVLDVSRRAVEAVVQQRGWEQAFAMCGLQGQEAVSKRLMARLGYETPPAVGSDLPNLCDLQATFPARSSIPIDGIFQTAVKAASPPRVVLRVSAAARLPRLTCCK
jgi:hypothetical protein